eukprot:CAMPEP_0168614876 /NCGR_PEP_ID=MMETSP0449_2-20121227/4210_1 /TAXON_ID=1082188 /ORGANISM="Strombidium rassoulzadegani, Strain ras09" /LENGTH=138 /DNA_ID=CAMNT_0008655589 /DNA_START=12 /DNA_END=428 /DNA_ORIENTATION=+
MKDLVYDKRDKEDQYFEKTDVRNTFYGVHPLKKYLEEKDYRVAASREYNCLNYAKAYSSLVISRAKEEDPEVFANDPVLSKLDDQELVNKFATNMCFKQRKMAASAFRAATASVRDKYYLKDDIIRLSNDGQKYHPYM